MEALLILARESGFAGLTPGSCLMFAVAGTLIYLAIAKDYEPLLLIPIGFGVLLANLPYAELSAGEHGLLGMIYGAGIKTGVMPPIIFMGVGVLTDFRPLLARPITFLLGAAAQFGIFAALLAAYYGSRFIPGLPVFSAQEAASIAIIGGADGPTSIFVTLKLAPHLLGPIAVAAYSYMSLVPVIQPPIIRLLTTQAEREIDMPEVEPASRTATILFPILVGSLASLAIPSSAPLMGLLMFGNLLRVCGVADRLKNTVGGPLLDIVTVFLGLTVGSTMKADNFLTSKTLMILALGAVAFAFSTAGGVLFAKGLNLILPEHHRMNPCIGAAGVSAVPMSARVVQKVVSDDTDGRVNPLMSAMGPNVAGVVGSAVVAGVFLALLQQR